MNEQIFVSYRRDGGDITAKLICEALKNQGYTVFYDYDSISGGFFDERIFESINDCNDFILVLSKNSLDRCTNEEDWVRQEIAYALKKNKHIIPVMLEDFEFPSNLPLDIKDIVRINSVHFIMAYFEGVIEAIKKRLHSKPGNSIPISQTDDHISEKLEFSFEEDLKGYSVSIGDCIETEIRIPDAHEGKAVVAIAEDGFRDCSAIKSVILPQSLKNIGKSAFYGCTSLKNINIPNSVTDIGKWAFYECACIERIAIPKSVKNIGARAFAKCTSLVHFEVDKDNRYFCDCDGNLYTKDMSVLLAYACGKSESSYTVPQGVTKIEECAFINASSLTTVSLPDSVKQIEKFAFKHCTELVDITIPQAVQTIAEDAFRECSALRSVVLPQGLKTIDESAFYGCALLKNINIPNSVTDIGKWAFYECACIESIAIPKSVKNIGARAFAKCTSLVRFEVDKDSRYFCDCDGNLYTKDMSVLLAYACGKRESSYTVPQGVTKIEECAFSNVSSLSAVFLPNSVKQIEKFAFIDCANLAAITLPDCATSIADFAFKRCTSLVNVTIPKGVQTIGEDAFRECSALKSIVFPQTLKNIGECAFNGCTSLKNINIPSNVTDIGKWAFYKCSSIESIAIPKNVRNIGARAFANCASLKKITVSLFNRSYCSKKNVLFSKDMKKLHAYAIGLEETSYTIPNSVNIIGDSAFSHSTLECITIPAKVADIGEYSFYHCKKLKVINFDGTVDMFKKISVKNNSFEDAQTNQIRCNDGVTKV